MPALISLPTASQDICTKCALGSVKQLTEHRVEFIMEAVIGYDEVLKKQTSTLLCYTIFSCKVTCHVLQRCEKPKNHNTGLRRYNWLVSYGVTGDRVRNVLHKHMEYLSLTRKSDYKHHVMRNGRCFYGGLKELFHRLIP